MLTILSLIIECSAGCFGWYGCGGYLLLPTFTSRCVVVVGWMGGIRSMYDRSMYTICMCMYIGV